MKTIASILIFWLTTINIFAQGDEFFVEHKTDRNAHSVRILHKNNGDIYLYAMAAPYDPAESGSPICGTHNVQSLIKVDDTGIIRDQQDVSTAFYGLDYIHVTGSHFAGVASNKSQRFENNMTWPCNELMLGIVDTVGLGDSVVQSSGLYIDSDCDFVSGGYMAMTHYNDYYYILYRKSNTEGKGTYLLKVNSTLTTATKTLINDKVHQAQVKSDGSGFHIFCQNPTNEYEFRLAELDLVGDISYLSQYMSSEEDQYYPDFLYDGESVFTNPKGHSEFFEVRKYNLNGDLIGMYDSGYMTQKMFFMFGGLFIVQRPVDTYNDSKPVKLALLNYDFNDVLGTAEYGIPRLHITDFTVDYSDGTFSVIGNTQNEDENSSVENNNVIYLLNGSLTDLSDGEEGSGRPESNGTFYPNPNQDSSVYLRLSTNVVEDADISDIRFYDMSGKLINPSYKQIATGHYEISTSDLTNGIYLSVAMHNNVKVVSQLLVVRK